MVLPIQMFNWLSRPTRDFHANAAATGIILVAITLALNSVAVAIRYRMRKRVKW
jgi:phosphate transport system permease protein